MKATVLDMRRKSGEIIRALERNETVTLYYRGQKKGVIYPAGLEKKKEKKRSAGEHPACGMWKDREDMKDVDAYMRKLRRGRVYDF